MVYIIFSEEIANSSPQVGYKWNANGSTDFFLVIEDHWIKKNMKGDYLWPEIL